MKWISTKEKMPPIETPVLIVLNGELRIGERRWDNPTWEENYTAYLYWDNPHDDGQDWNPDDVTHWMLMPDYPKENDK